MSEVGLSTPTPEDLAAYLTIHGWRRDAGGRSASLWALAGTQSARLGVSEVGLPSDEDTALLVPHVASATDYAARVDMLVEHLALLQGETANQIRRDVSLVHFDVAPLRAADPDIDDSIPLQSGLELLNAARKMVVAAAGATIRRQSHFGRTLPGQAREHSHVVRVGQTQRGSYIIPIISRARFGLSETLPEEHLDIEVEQSLFDRRVMSTFAKAMGVLEEITTSSQSTSGSELTDAVSLGVSRELCQGILKALKSSSISELSLSFQWAPATSAPRGTPGAVSFHAESAPLLEHISEQLRVLDLPREDVLYGVVTELRHRPNDPDYRVGVEALIGRRARTVYMYLTPEQYEVAKECHERSKVIVRGQLRAPVGDRAHIEVDYFGPDESLIDIAGRIPQPDSIF